MDDEARVWQVGNDENERIDSELVNEWTKILDTLLIFVSSFFFFTLVLLIKVTRRLFSRRS